MSDSAQPTDKSPRSAGRFVYWIQGAPDENPHTVMRRFADESGFRILGSVPQTIADQIWFWIEWGSERPVLPTYISEGKWLPVGTV